MIDDYKYSIGRTVVYKHPNPACPNRDYGQYGPTRTVGVVRAVDLDHGSDNLWRYRIENLRTGETEWVLEPDIYHDTLGRRERRSRVTKADAKHTAEAIAATASDSIISNFLRNMLRDFLRREEAEKRIREEGADLPIRAGDYVRIKGDLRPEVESHHNHYAKVLEVSDADIQTIQSTKGHYKVRRKYMVHMDDGSKCEVYDPEIKLYYTYGGRSTILNWRAAKFLAEAFGDDPPYSVENSYLEDHVFSRDELEPMLPEDLNNLLAMLLYVKGRIGLRDLQRALTNPGHNPKEQLVDSILAISRFDLRKNRSLTESEIENKRKEEYKLRRLLRR